MISCSLSVSSTDMVLKFLMGVDTYTGNLRYAIDMCMGMSVAVCRSALICARIASHFFWSDAAVFSLRDAGEPMYPRGF